MKLLILGPIFYLIIGLLLIPCCEWKDGKKGVDGPPKQVIAVALFWPIILWQCGKKGIIEW
jgi:hypothetical protein